MKHFLITAPPAVASELFSESGGSRLEKQVVFLTNKDWVN